MSNVYISVINDDLKIKKTIIKLLYVYDSIIRLIKKILLLDYILFNKKLLNKKDSIIRLIKKLYVKLQLNNQASISYMFKTM